MVIKFPVKRYSAILAFLAGFSTIACAQTESAAFTPDQQKKIEKITHDYLVSHPQLLIEMATALQKQQEAAWQQTAKKVVPQMANALFTNQESPIAGNPQGNVVMVEFFDYQCPHCKEMQPQVETLIKDNANLKVIFKPLPLYGQISEFAAKAGLAAQRQRKFKALHEALMTQTSPLTQELILKTAQSVGLDISRLQSDMQTPEANQELKQNANLATLLKLAGTPAFVFAKLTADGEVKNPLLIPGAVDISLLAKAIAEVQQTQPSSSLQ